MNSAKKYRNASEKLVKTGNSLIALELLSGLRSSLPSVFKQTEYLSYPDLHSSEVCRVLLTINHFSSDLNQTSLAADL